MCCSINTAFFQQLELVPVSISSLLGKVTKDSAKELREHEKGGKLFTVHQSFNENNNTMFALGSAGQTSHDLGKQNETNTNIFHQPMDSPAKALSLLATCAYLADHMVMHVTQLHLPLLCGDVEAEKGRCMKRAQEVCHSFNNIPATRYHILLFLSSKHPKMYVLLCFEM